MLKFVSKLQWLALIGFLGVLLDNQYLRLFFLFWLCCLADVFSPMRSIFSNLIFLIQNLWMLAGILIAHLRHGFNLPDKNTYNPQVLYSLPFDGEWFVVNGGTDRKPLILGFFRPSDMLMTFSLGTMKMLPLLAKESN